MALLIADGLCTGLGPRVLPGEDRKAVTRGLTRLAECRWAASAAVGDAIQQTRAGATAGIGMDGGGGN